MKLVLNPKCFIIKIIDILLFYLNSLQLNYSKILFFSNISFRTYTIRIAENEIILDDSLFNIFSNPEPIYFRSIEGIEKMSQSKVSTNTGKVIIQVEIGNQLIFST